MLGSDGFDYADEWRGNGTAVLEFRSVVNGLDVHGVDMIAWDEAGRITSFTVMIRPLKALHAVVARMGAALTA